MIDKIITGLIIIIAIVIVVTIIMIISDYRKKKNKVEEESPQGIVVPEEPIQPQSLPFGSVVNATEQDTKNEAIIDYEAETDVLVGTDPSIIATAQNDDSVIEVSSQVDTQIAQTQINETSSEIGFVEDKTSNANTYIMLLERIADEMSKQAIEEGRLFINYLIDEMPNLKQVDNVFYLRNEDVISTDGNVPYIDDKFMIRADSDILIRFCVNFYLPLGVMLKVLADDNSLTVKGLQLIDIIDSNSNVTSIRAKLHATKDTVIRKDEELFSAILEKEET